MIKQNLSKSINKFKTHVIMVILNITRNKLTKDDKFFDVITKFASNCFVVNISFEIYGHTKLVNGPSS